MFGQHRYTAENSRINRIIEERGVVISAHRGTATGSIIENTLDAIRAAVRSAAIMIEIDVIASVDGVHFLFHDGLEPLRFGTMQNINSMTSSQIRSLTYLERNTTASAVRVEELSAVLDYFRGQDVLLNIDRSWWYWDTLLPVLDAYDMCDQIVLKSDVDDAVLAQLRSHEVKFPFIPMVRSFAEINKVLGDPEINLVGVELLADSPRHEFAAPEAFARLHDEGLLCLANAMNLGNRKPLFAGYDDEVSVLVDPEKGWGELVRLGADIIQTDWVALLANYLSDAGVTRQLVGRSIS